MQKQISLHNLIDASRLNPFTKGLVSAIDIMLGIRKMNRLYHQYQMQDLSKEAFADRLLEILNIRVEGEDELLAKIPRHRPGCDCQQSSVWRYRRRHSCPRNQ